MGLLGFATELALKSQLDQDRARLSIMLADRAAGKSVREEDIRRWTQVIREREDAIRQLQLQSSQKAQQEMDDRRRRDEKLRDDLKRSKQRLFDRERAEDRRLQQQFEDRRFHATQAAQTEGQWWADYASTDTPISQDDIAALEMELASTEVQPSSEASWSAFAIKNLQASLVLLNESDAKLLPNELFLAHKYLSSGVDEKNQFTQGLLFERLDPEDFPSKKAFRAAASAPNFMPALKCALTPWSEQDLAGLYLECEHPDFVEFGEIPWMQAEGRNYAIWWDSKRERYSYILSKADGSVESKTCLNDLDFGHKKNNFIKRDGHSVGFYAANQFGDEFARISRPGESSGSILIFRKSLALDGRTIEKRTIPVLNLFKAGDNFPEGFSGRDCYNFGHNDRADFNSEGSSISLLASSRRYSRNYLFLRDIIGVKPHQKYWVNSDESFEAREASKIRLAVLDADTGEILAQLSEKLLRQLLGPLPLKEIETPQSTVKELVKYSMGDDRLWGVLALEEQDRFVVVLVVYYRIENKVSEKKGLAARINKWMNGSEEFKQGRSERRMYAIDFGIESLKINQVVDVTKGMGEDWVDNFQFGFFKLHLVDSEIKVIVKTDKGEQMVFGLDSKTLQPVMIAQKDDVLVKKLDPLPVPRKQMEPVSGIPLGVISRLAGGECRLVRSVGSD